MALSSYSDLKTAIAEHLARSDLTSFIDDFIDLAEARIYREVRIRAMETALSSAIASGVVAVPSGYLAMKFAYVDGSPTTPLFPTTLESLYSQYPTRSAYGRPRVIAREGTNFIFGPYPDSDYTIKGVYYKRLDGLSASNTSNWLITDAPDLILYGSLLAATPFIQDDQRLVVWAELYRQAKERVQEQDDAEEASGGVLRPRMG